MFQQPDTLTEGMDRHAAEGNHGMHCTVHKECKWTKFLLLSAYKWDLLIMYVCVCVFWVAGSVAL